MKRITMAALIVLAATSRVASDGISNRAQIGDLGGSLIGSVGSASVPTIPCTQTGLVFTASCNAILFVVVFN